MGTGACCVFRADPQVLVLGRAFPCYRRPRVPAPCDLPSCSNQLPGIREFGELGPITTFNPSLQSRRCFAREHRGFAPIAPSVPSRGWAARPTLSPAPIWAWGCRRGCCAHARSKGASAGAVRQWYVRREPARLWPFPAGCLLRACREKDHTKRPGELRRGTGRRFVPFGSPCPSVKQLHALGECTPLRIAEVRRPNLMSMRMVGVHTPGEKEEARFTRRPGEESSAVFLG